MPARRLVPALATVLALLLSACGPSTTASPSAAVASAGLPSAGPSSAGPSGAIASPAPPSPGPTRPPGALAMPATFGVELEPGTYFSSPPFELAFTFDVAEPGWIAGHLNDEFFDLQRYAGEPGVGVLPTRMVGFGHPDSFNRDDGEVPVSELSPQGAVDVLANRRLLEASNVADLEIFGLPGVRIDLHSDFNNNPIFGGDDGNFGLFPELDLRLVVVDIGDGDLLALVLLAPPDELEDAWTESRAILESVELYR